MTFARHPRHILIDFELNVNRLARLNAALGIHSAARSTSMASH
jgi:hypothetical protein